MIPSTLLIVLFVQWTSSWIDFTLNYPIKWWGGGWWWWCSGDGAGGAGGVAGDRGGGEGYLAIHKTLEQVDCLLSSTKRTVASVPDHALYSIIIIGHHQDKSPSASLCLMIFIFAISYTYWLWISILRSLIIPDIKKYSIVLYSIVLYWSSQIQRNIVLCYANSVAHHQH